MLLLERLSDLEVVWCIPNVRLRLQTIFVNFMTKYRQTNLHVPIESRPTYTVPIFDPSRVTTLQDYTHFKAPTSLC